MADIINENPHAGNQTPIDVTDGQEIVQTTEFKQKFERAINVTQGIIAYKDGNGTIHIVGGKDHITDNGPYFRIFTDEAGVFVEVVHLDGTRTLYSVGEHGYIQSITTDINP